MVITVNNTLLLWWARGHVSDRMLPAMLVNKGCCSHLATRAAPRVSPEGTQDRNRMSAIQPSAPAANPQGCTPRRLRMGKHRILAPDS